MIERETRCSFRPSTHTKDKMIDRGISKDEILEAIQKGAKRFTQDGRIIALLHDYEVVYKPFPCNYFVITVYIKNR